MKIIGYMFRNAKRRAREKGIPFEITAEDIVIPEVCPVFKVPLRAVANSRIDKLNWWYSPSLDRIDPQKGYVKGNVQVISLRANRIKCDATPEELRLVYEYCRDNWGAR